MNTGGSSARVARFLNLHTAKSGRKGLVAIMSLAASAIFCAPITNAQLTDCRGIANGPDYKIAVDDVTSPPMRAGRSAVMPTDVKRLTADIQIQVEDITVEEGGAIIPVACAGRRPQSELDFDRNLVEALNSNNVVLEVWGSLDNTIAANPRGDNAALLRFVLVPVRYYEHFLNNSSTLVGFYLVLYSPTGSGGGLSLFERSNELRGSVALSMALKKMKEGRNDLALQYLCKAELFFRQPDIRISSGKRDELLEYIRGLKASALSAGRTSAASLLTSSAKADVCSAPPK